MLIPAGSCIVKAKFHYAIQLAKPVREVVRELVCYLLAVR